MEEIERSLYSQIGVDGDQADYEDKGGSAPPQYQHPDGEGKAGVNGNYDNSFRVF